MVLLGCWALYQAVYAESILRKMLWAYTIYSAALTPVVLAAFYSKRVTAWGAGSSYRHWNGSPHSPGTGLKFTALFPPIIAQRDAIFPALIAALLAMIIGSLFTRKPSAANLAQFGD